MNNTYKEMIKSVIDDGYESAPRGLKVKEIINFSVKVNDIINCGFNYESRKFQYKYLAAELGWYLNGGLNTEYITKYASLWGRISDENGEARSNYGYLVFGKEHEQTGKTQYQWCLNSLKKDKDSRQAIMLYNNYSVQVEGIKDFICTLSQQFFIRNNKLIGITNMRSTDLFYGFSYDIIWFNLVMQSLYLDLKKKYPEIKLGEMYFNTGSAHIYESMYEKSDEIIKEDGSSIDFELKESFQDQFNNIFTNEEEFFGCLKLNTDYKMFIEKQFSINIKEN